MKVLVFLALCASAAATQRPMLIGGYTNQDPTNPDFLEMAWKPVVTTTVNSDASNANSNYAFVPVKVLSARTQVVAGMNYDLEVQFGQSDCSKNTNELNSSSCPASANGATKVYRMTIFSQPWTKTLEVTKIEEVKPNNSSR